MTSKATPQSQRTTLLEMVRERRTVSTPGVYLSIADLIADLDLPDSDEGRLGKGLPGRACIGYFELDGTVWGIRGGGQGSRVHDLARAIAGGTYRIRETDTGRALDDGRIDLLHVYDEPVKRGVAEPIAPAVAFCPKCFTALPTTGICQWC